MGTKDRGKEGLLDIATERPLTDDEIRKLAIQVAKDVRDIRNNVSQMRHLAVMWGFMGGIIPALIVIILSVLKLALTK